MKNEDTPGVRSVTIEVTVCYPKSGCSITRRKIISPEPNGDPPSDAVVCNEVADLAHNLADMIARR